MKITLDKDTHTYRSSDGIKYKSVSSLIDQFVPFFDFEQKSYDYAIKYNIPVEEVRASWREKNKQSTKYGHEIHQNIELLLKEKTFSHKEKLYDDIVKQIEKLVDTKTHIYTEQILHDEDYKVAGTTDLILDRKADFDIIDFKTNKKIKFENPFDDGTLLFPLAHLPNAEYFKYALQLSLYALMHEKATKKRVYRLSLFWFKRKKPDDYEVFEGTWIKYSLPYLKEEAKTILEYGAKK